ncbi:MAG TPA: hypothetical protein VE221_07145 [Sphingomicrobium sp.]|jgi:hypothetical protein|nr:hypothetical protein [Sphingomicrobium sp.]
MHAVSLSRAWDETRAIIIREERLFVSVALALVAFPVAVEGLVSPRGMDPYAPWWVDLIVIATSLIALAGQLALIRLALAPSITVGGAISHGVRRMPIYLLAVILIMVGLFVVAIPFAAALAFAGVPLPAKGAQASLVATIAVLLYSALIVFVAVRMLMGAPVASAERAGPIAILRRSWHLTAGNWLRLFAFLVMFLIAAVALVGGLGAATAVVVRLFVGPIAPLSTGALVVALIQALFNTVVTTGLAVMLARIYVQLSGRGEVEPSVPTTGT